MGASRASRHRYARYAAMPISTYRFTRDHLLPPDQHSRRWSGPPVPFLLARGGCPVTHCQLACLLATIREDSFPSFRVPLVSLPILPRIFSRQGRCGSPSFPILPPPYLVPPAPTSPCIIIWSSWVSSASLQPCPAFFFLWGRIFCLQPILSTLELFGVLFDSFPLSTPPFPLVFVFPTDHPPSLTISTFFPSSCTSYGSTLSTSSSVTRVILLLRTYLAGILQVYMLGETSPGPYLFFSNLPFQGTLLFYLFGCDA